MGIDNTSDNDEAQDFTPQELESIKENFKNYWSAEVLTYNPSITNKPTFSVSLELGVFNPIIFYFEKATVTPLFIKIRYRKLDRAVIPAGQNSILQEVFLNSFNALNSIGKDFEPHSYLSTQNVDWVAEIESQWSMDGNTYTSDKLENESYFNKYIISRTDGGYNIVFEEF